MAIRLPYNFEPRPYQLDIFKAFDSGYKRGVLVWHRRAGKDKTLFNLLIKKAFERKGVYYYFFPEFSQGRRVIWQGIDGAGNAFMEHLPEQLIDRKRDDEMMMKLSNGSIIQIVGTDSFDKVRGSNPVGCVFSEFAYQNPAAWDVVRPILAENGGWALFNSTPNGHNHFHKMYKMALKNKDWFCQKLTVEDSMDENGNRFVPDSVVQAEREAGMMEEMVQQEFYCSFEASTDGYYYLDLLNKADKEGRVLDFVIDKSKPTFTYWDLGISDATAIWFVQPKEDHFDIVDYYESSGEPLSEYIKMIKNSDYNIEGMIFPHDIKQRELSSGKARIDAVRELAPNINSEVVPRLPVIDGIERSRVKLSLSRFHKTNTKKGRDALENYKKKYDRDTRTFQNSPQHTWASHGADAFRMFSVFEDSPSDVYSRNRKVERFLHKLESKNHVSHYMVA